MKSLLRHLCLCLVVALLLFLPGSRASHQQTSWLRGSSGPPNRCDGLGFDAIALDDHGFPYYFRDEFVWRGFRGQPQLMHSIWQQLPTHLDAAFRMHDSNHPDHHNRTFFFKGEHVWQYLGNTLEGKFLIRDKFPGVPDNLGGAMECLQGDCMKNSILFSKGDTMYVLDLSTKALKARNWQGVRGCSTMMRWIDRYYCFTGTNFTRFNPSTGEVPPGYPKDIRDYFMSCEGRGHWSRNSTVDRKIFSLCSNAAFDEFDEDELGRVYAFRDNWYFRIDKKREGWHPFFLNSSWTSLHGKLNGVFSWDKKMYFIQGSQLYIYKAETRYRLIEGYPKPVSDELGISGIDVNATFICPNTSLLYVITGNHMRVIDLKQSPRVLGDGVRIGHSLVDGAMCNRRGIYLFIGTQYYRYNSPSELSAWHSLPDPHSIKGDFLHCPHREALPHHR
ncbi:hemopexin [Hypanus sabinus]|uniref:hemopexin n=1 Tax=Hypanus sabinus TaxID=79690 RepID=UPI0028C46466|nr:hemopexin [Hypanus sabinus]